MGGSDDEAAYVIWHGQERLPAGGPDEGYSRYGKQTGAVQH